MGKWQLTDNPFSRKSVLREEDYQSELTIITSEMQSLLNRFDWGFDPKNSLHEILIGDRGCGKTTDLLTIKHHIDLEKMDDIKTVYLNDYIVLPTDTDKLFGESYMMNSDEEALILKRGRIGSARHYFVFIDMPDEYKKDPMLKTIRAISTLFLLSNVHLYIAFNHENFVKADALSQTLGKITHRYMSPFQVSETLTLVEKRLAYYRVDDYQGDALYPFTPDVINYVHDRCKGNPRNLLSYLSIALDNLKPSDSDIIDADLFESMFTSGNYRKEILRDKIGNPLQYQLFETLLEEIEGEPFNGIVESQKDITDYMGVNHKWSHVTTTKRLKRLVKYGLLDMVPGKTSWMKSYRLR